MQPTTSPAEKLENEERSRLEKMVEASKFIVAHVRSLDLTVGEANAVMNDAMTMLGDAIRDKKLSEI